MYNSTPPSPEVENFQIKIYYATGYRTPDLLNQRQTCYHLSQRDELNNINYDRESETLPNPAIILFLGKIWHSSLLLSTPQFH